jgi:arabinan endo-1,5-alpha-L-arabinosidase
VTSSRKTRIPLVLALGVAATTCMAALAGAPATFGSDQPVSAAASATGSFRNPVLNSPFPDPYVLRTPNHWYYAYATQGKDRSRHLNVQVARSRNLVHWDLRGDALPRLPSWGNRAALSWGPHVVRHAGRYYLYYSLIPDRLRSKSQLCLAVATSRSPGGPFVTTSKPLYCGPGLVAVGPAVLHDRATGHWQLYWGYGGALVTVRLASNLTSLIAPNWKPKILLHKKENQPYEHTIESPFVIDRHGWYYLFYSGNRCCTYPPHYATMVARSRHATGPYHRLSAARPGPSSVILHSSHRFVGPGSNSVVRDGAGHDWIVYHAVDTHRPYNPGGRSVRRVMLINRMVYRNGWPTIATHAPTDGLRPAGLTR